MAQTYLPYYLPRVRPPAPVSAVSASPAVIDIALLPTSEGAAEGTGDNVTIAPNIETAAAAKGAADISSQQQEEQQLEQQLGGQLTRAQKGQYADRNGNVQRTVWRIAQLSVAAGLVNSAAAQLLKMFGHKVLHVYFFGSWDPDTIIFRKLFRCRA